MTNLVSDLTLYFPGVYSSNIGTIGAESSVEGRIYCIVNGGKSSTEGDGKELYTDGCISKKRC